MTNPTDIALDGAAAIGGAGTVVSLYMSWLQGAEGLVIGALVIVLTLLRIRSHLRRDRDEQKARP